MSRIVRIVQLGTTLNPDNFVKRADAVEFSKDYCAKNNFSKEVENVVYSALVQDWIGVVLNIGILQAKEYEQDS